MAARTCACIILLGAAVYLVACSAQALDRDKLPIEDLVKGPESDCADLAALDFSFSPSKSHGEAEVYAVDGVRVDSEYVATMAEKLGISGEPAEYSVTPRYGVYDFSDPPEIPVWYVKDANGELMVETWTGNIMFSGTDSSAASGKNNVVSEDSAKDIARQFLSNLGLLLPPDDLAEVSLQPGGDVFNLVWLPRSFKIAKRYTPLHIEIAVGYDGVVEGMDYTWQDLRPVGEYPLAAPAEAVERVKGCDAIFSSNSPSPSVEEVRTEYIGVPTSGPFQYFVPVYRFGNDLDSVDTPEAAADRAYAGRATDAYVLAIADDYIELPAPKATPTASR